MTSDDFASSFFIGEKIFFLATTPEGDRLGESEFLLEVKSILALLDDGNRSSIVAFDESSVCDTDNEVSLVSAVLSQTSDADGCVRLQLRLQLAS
uniref:DUF2326 domain-containing protein n=1 Tax=Syphacia muris TaxID=451379 RepID=A0A0N5AUP4_9BILA